MSQTHCSLRYQVDDKQVDVPFSGMHVNAHVVELAAHFQANYFFENKLSTAIGPALFRFPLSEEVHSDMNEGLIGGIIREFTANIIGSTMITSWICTKEDLVEPDQNDDDNPEVRSSMPSLCHVTDLLEVRMPQIPAHTLVHIRVSFVTSLLKYSPYQSAIELTFPLHLAPAASSHSDGKAWSDIWKQHAFGDDNGSIWSLPIPEPLQNRPSPSPFSLVIDAQVASLEKVSSLTHTLSWVSVPSSSLALSPTPASSSSADFKDPKRALVCYLSDHAPITTDVVILFHPEYSEMCSNVRVEVADGSACAMLTLYPDAFPDELFQTHQSEVVFLVDCSGSMSQGLKIPSTIAALEILLRSLDPKCSFNIYRFGSSFQSLYRNSQPYTRESLEEALLYVTSKVRPDLQGTKILPPLRHIFDENQKQPASFIRPKPLQIFVLTDGQVEKPSDVIAACQEASNRAPIRIWSVGVGRDASRFLVEGIARSTGGCAAFVTDSQIGSQLDEKMVHLLRCATIPSVSQIEIEWTHTAPMPSPGRVSTPSSMVNIKMSPAHHTLADSRTIPAEFCCPITSELMQTPVIAMDGHTYEKFAIESWFSHRSSSPMTNLPMDNILIPNIALRNLITQFLEKSTSSIVPDHQSLPSLTDAATPSEESSCSRVGSDSDSDGASKPMSVAPFLQAPFILPPFFAGKEYVVFAMFPNRSTFPFSFVRVTFRNEEKQSRTIELPIQSIEPVSAATLFSPIHLLGAKFLISQLEEGTSHLHMKLVDADAKPEPLSVPAEAIANELIDYGMRFSFPSSETFLCAIEEHDGVSTPLQSAKQQLSSDPSSSPHGSFAIVDGKKVPVLRFTVSKPGKHGTAKAFVTFRDPKTGNLRETIVAQRDLVISEHSAPQATSLPAFSSSSSTISSAQKSKFTSFFAFQQFDGSYHFSKCELAQFLGFSSAPSPLEAFEFTFNGEIIPIEPSVWTSIFALAVLDLYFSDLISLWDVGASKTTQYCATALSCPPKSPFLKHLICCASDFLRSLKNSKLD